MSNGKEPLQSYINQACGRSSVLANGNAREMWGARYRGLAASAHRSAPFHRASYDGNRIGLTRARKSPLSAPPQFFFLFFFFFFFGVLEIFNKGLHNVRDFILWQACGCPKEVASARKTQKYRVALCLTIQQLTRMKLKFSEREEKHGNPNSFSGDAVVASAKGCPVWSRCGWVVRVLLFWVVYPVNDF